MAMRDWLASKVPAALRKASTEMDDGERERILASRIQSGAWILVLIPVFRITAGRAGGDLELFLVVHAAVLTALLCVGLTQSWPRRAPLAFAGSIVGVTMALYVVEVVLTGAASWLLLCAAFIPVAVSVALPWPLNHQLAVVAITSLGLLFGAAIAPASLAALGPSAALVGGVASLLITHVREGSRLRRATAVEARLQRQIVLRELQAKLERSACDAALAGLLEPQAAEAAHVHHVQLTDAQAEAEAELARLQASLEATVERSEHERDTRARTEAALAECERALSWATLAADGVARQNAEYVAQADRQRAELDELRNSERELAAAANHLTEAKQAAETRARELASLLDQAHEQAACAAAEGVRLHRALEDRERDHDQIAAELGSTHARYAAEIDALRVALDRETGICRASRDTLHDTEERLERAEAECGRLAAELVQAREVAAAEAGKRKVAERELASSRHELQHERSAAAERGREWTQRLTALETRLASELAAQQQLRDEIDAAERSWSETEQARAHGLSRLVAELDRARSAVAQEARQRDCVESALAEAELRLESSKAKAEARIREATAELDSARSNLQRERDARSAAEAVASAATAESLRQRAWAERRVSELEERWVNAGEHRDEELAAELAAARGEMARRLEADQHALAAANAAAAGHLGRIRELEADLGRRDLRMAELTEELRDVRAVFEGEVHRLHGALEREGEARVQAEAEAEGAQLRVHERDREIERLGGDLAAETKARKRAEDELADKLRELAAASRGFDARVEHLTSSLRRATDTASAESERASGLARQLRELEDDLEARVAAARHEVVDREAAVAHARESWERQRSRAGAQRKELEEAVRTARAALAESEQAAARSADTAESACAELAFEAEQRKALEAELAAATLRLQRGLGAAEAEAVEREKLHAALEADLAVAQEANQGLAGELQQVRARLAAAEEGLRERDAVLQRQVDETKRALATEIGERREIELELALSEEAFAEASGEHWKDRFEAAQQARADEGRRRREAEERLQTVRAETEVDLPMTRHQLEALRAELRQAKESLAREVRQREAAVGTLRVYRNQMQLRHGWINETMDHVRPMLASVRGCLDEIAESERDAERRQRLASVRVETWSVARTIEDLLDIEAMHSSGRRVPRESAAISEVLVETFAMLANDSDTTWKLDAEPRLPAVYVETGPLFQLLGNFLAFASSTAAKGGTLTVSARHCKGEVVVAVRAPGVAAGNDADQVFGRFSTTADGSGLQPVLTKTIAESFGGRVWAENNGDGTGTLAVALPAFHADDVLGPVAVQRCAGASYA